jgi:hypothetical protein
MAWGEYVGTGDYAVIGQTLYGIYISAGGLLEILIFYTTGTASGF